MKLLEHINKDQSCKCDLCNINTNLCWVENNIQHLSIFVCKKCANKILNIFPKHAPKLKEIIRELDLK